MDKESEFMEILPPTADPCVLVRICDPPRIVSWLVAISMLPPTKSPGASVTTVTINAPSDTSWGSKENPPLRIPIAHHDGRYVADDDTLKLLSDSGRVAFVYCDAKGEPIPDSNPNGSMRNIAGITNERGNVLGMMPHPERATNQTLGCTDGLNILRQLLD